MADDQDLAALRAQVAALEARMQQIPQRPSGSPAAGRGAYAVHTHIHAQAFELCYMPIPPGEGDDLPLQQQLSRIEAKLDQLIALLEK